MRLEFLSGEQVADRVHQFAAVYRAAFAGAPYHRQAPEVTDFIRGLPLQAQRQGFRAVVAFLAGAEPGPVGVAYGYRSAPGQWWYDNVSRGLGAAAGLWLADAFQVTEVAVMPAHQRQGIGGALLDALLAGAPYERALLSTLDAETPGRAMYRARGWQELLDNFYFPGVARRYAIMGRLLHQE